MRTRDPARRRSAIGRPAPRGVLRGLLLALAFGPFAARSDALPAAVRVGDEAVPELWVEAALDRCRARAEAGPAKSCVEIEIEPWWLVRAARDGRLDSGSSYRRTEQRVLADALLEELARRAPEPDPADVERAVLEDRREFEKPERFRLFRILVTTEAEVAKLRSELPRVVTPESFRQLARVHSLDRATHQRGGDLGFVAPDGTTDIPEVRVDPALYRAAKELEDGEIAPGAVAEGNHFALLWRRGTLAPKPLDRPLAERHARARLLRERTEIATTRLVADLEKAHLREHHPERLDGKKFPLPR